jgi:hypothetical protein
MTDTVKSLFVREWLNKDTGRGYVIVSADAEKSDKHGSWVDAGLEIGDCNPELHQPRLLLR